MENDKLFLAVIDDPNSCNADFDYTVCATGEIAVDYLINAIRDKINEAESITCNGENVPLEKFIQKVIQLLVEKSYVECNGIYYRITEADYLK